MKRSKNNKFIILIVFFTYSIGIIFSGNVSANNVKILSTTYLDSSQIIIEEEKIEDKEKEKNILKKEIQKRKKYQNNLILNYNNTLEKEVLDLIIKNGIILDGLKSEYNNFFSKNKPNI